MSTVCVRGGFESAKPVTARPSVRASYVEDDLLVERAVSARFNSTDPGIVRGMSREEIKLAIRAAAEKVRAR